MTLYIKQQQKLIVTINNESSRKSPKWFYLYFKDISFFPLGLFITIPHLRVCNLMQLITDGDSEQIIRSSRIPKGFFKHRYFIMICCFFIFALAWPSVQVLDKAFKELTL